MIGLAEAQTAMLAAIYDGPDALPATLFSGPRRRVELGMAVHANTIAHGRISALLDSFPRLLAHVGEEEMRILAQAYTALPGARACALIHIGGGFLDWLAVQDAPSVLVELAQVDAAALACLHAADAPVLQLAHLPQDPEALLALYVCLHPAAAVLDAPLALAALGTAGHAALVVRNGYVVDVLGVEATPAAMARSAEQGATIAQLLEQAEQMTGAKEALDALLALINAAAIQPVKGYKACDA